jgi:hypothetical protein
MIQHIHTIYICVSVCIDAVSRWTRPAFNFRPAPCEVSTASARERFDSSVHAVFWLDPAHFHVYLLYSTPSCPAHSILLYALLLFLCSFLCFTLLDSTLLYMYRLTAFKASELRYFRLRCFCTPHLCVGFLVFVSVSRPRPPPVRTTLSRAIFHNTIFHAQLCHTQSFTTQSFTHILTLSHTIFHNTNFHIHISHTQLCHTQCFTIFPHISPTHNLSQHNRCCISLLFLWVAESFSAAVAHLSNSAPCLCWPSAARSHQATSVPLSETKRCVAILHPFLHLVCRTCFYLYSWHISLISMLLCPNA